MYEMNPASRRSPYRYPDSRGALPARSANEATAYIRKVYLYFTGGIFFAIVGAMGALYLGNPVLVQAGQEAVALPPLVAFGMEHFIIMTLLYLGAFFAASFARRVPGLNLVALFGYALVTGVFLAPTIFIAQAMASQGQTLDASPVRDAFLLTGVAFTGLSGYALVSGKNFSFLGAALNTGLWVVLGASILGLFFHAAVFQLAIASAGVLLFAGYILYDTSRLLHDRTEDDAIGAALRLFLDVVNMFVFLLRIFSSSRER